MLICQTAEPSERGFTPKFEIVILISRSGESWFTVLAFKHFTEPLLLIIGEKTLQSHILLQLYVLTTCIIWEMKLIFLVINLYTKFLSSQKWVLILVVFKSRVLKIFRIGFEKIKNKIIQCSIKLAD